MVTPYDPSHSCHTSGVSNMAYIPRGVAGFPGSQYKPVVKILQNWGPLFFLSRQLWRMQEKTDTSATGADSMSWHVYSLDVPPAQNY